MVLVKRPARAGRTSVAEKAILLLVLVKGEGGGRLDAGERVNRNPRSGHFALFCAGQ